MEKPLRILHLEDDPRDVELVQQAFKAAGIRFVLHCVQHKEGFLAALDGGKIDLILADYTLPSFDGMTALTLAREKSPGIPFIFVTGTLGEERAVESLKCGAADYVLKQRLFRLAPVLLRACKEAGEMKKHQSAEMALRKAKEETEQLLSSIASILIGINKNDRIIRWNKTAERRLSVKGPAQKEKSKSARGTMTGWWKSASATTAPVFRLKSGREFLILFLQPKR